MSFPLHTYLLSNLLTHRWNHFSLPLNFLDWFIILLINWCIWCRAWACVSWSNCQKYVWLWGSTKEALYRAGSFCGLLLVLIMSNHSVNWLEYNSRNFDMTNQGWPRGGGDTASSTLVTLVKVMNCSVPSNLYRKHWKRCLHLVHVSEFWGSWDWKHAKFLAVQ